MYFLDGARTISCMRVQFWAMPVGSEMCEAKKIVQWFPLILGKCVKMVQFVLYVERKDSSLGLTFEVDFGFSVTILQGCCHTIRVTKILWSFVLKLNWCGANGYTILLSLCANVANLQYVLFDFSIENSLQTSCFTVTCNWSLWCLCGSNTPQPDCCNKSVLQHYWNSFVSSV